ncbi:hypothetical protein JZ751_012127 [Albula glossodonta]|uniref:Docking protein 2 n=1 Tax=Albula glossodonta TaxID=121402 RepID=A0A8T2PRL9_9TELE|nr:hypothetical protein JZ751_012127 [Albula glossodonta]
MMATIEEAVRKKGMLYIQHQRFGKKWKKVWSLVYGESSCSVSRLELFECRDDAERSDRKRSKRDTRKVIRMSEFVRVSEEKVSACPQGCGTFLVETSEKSFLFAAEMSELDDWIQTLCEIAFPMNKIQYDAFKTSDVQESEAGMVENSIYCTSTELKDFHVMVKKTEASERCQLHGAFILRVDIDGLHLLNPKSGIICFTWPYRYIRKFGVHLLTFSFEAGRRSDSGEGIFEFKTKQKSRIFEAVDAAINLQSREDGSSSGQDWVPGSTPGHGPVIPDEDDLYSKVQKVRKPRRPEVDLLTGLEEMTLDDRVSPFRDSGKGREMSSRPLPNPHSWPSLDSGPSESVYHLVHRRDSEDQDQEPDYEEVDPGAVAEESLSLYDNLVEVKRNTGLHSMVEDPVGQGSPWSPGTDEYPASRQLRRMLTNPHFDYNEEDIDTGEVEQIMTHL